MIIYTALSFKRPRGYKKKKQTHGKYPKPPKRKKYRPEPGIPRPDRIVQVWTLNRCAHPWICGGIVETILGIARRARPIAFLKERAWRVHPVQLYGVNRVALLRLDSV